MKNNKLNITRHGDIQKCLDRESVYTGEWSDTLLKREGDMRKFGFAGSSFSVSNIVQKEDAHKVAIFVDGQFLETLKAENYTVKLLGAFNEVMFLFLTEEQLEQLSMERSLNNI